MIQDTGYNTQDTGYWIQDTGQRKQSSFQILDFDADCIFVCCLVSKLFVV